MTPTLPTTDAPPFVPPYPVTLPEENLPYDDGVPMDSPWQRGQMFLSIEILRTNWKGKRYYCGGNMFIYYSRELARNRDFRGPDFYVVLDVDPDKPRLYWAVWDEHGRYPNFILELLSPSTTIEDLTTKKDIYEQTFGTHEYICYDPEEDKLQGWRLQKRYRPIPLEAGRIWCESLELWIGPWQGSFMGTESTWLRFFDREGRMLPTAGEFEAARAKQAEDEADRLRKEVESLRQQLQTPTS